jgi:LmbE family N-acetylglucosaminyl deacetylase
MYIEDLSRAGNRYRHIYLSPHLDDAALSCGGRIATQVAAGEQTLAITLCTASPPPEGPFSALARQFHADWGLAPGQVVAARLEEDALAMERLGCDYHWAGMLDAIYRYPEAYDSRDSLFNAPAPDDPLFAALRHYVGELRARFPEATFYAPLGVGRHVDHLVAFAAAREALGAGARFYEDIHYVLHPGALERRMAAIGGALDSESIAIDATLGRKLDAIRAYASQLPELFGSTDAMEPAVSEYAHKVRPAGAEYGERVWRLGSPT